MEYGRDNHTRYRLAIRGKITTHDEASSETIKTAFKATFLAGSAEGGVSRETKQISAAATAS